MEIIWLPGRSGILSSTFLSVSTGRFSNSTVATFTELVNSSRASVSSKGLSIILSAVDAAPDLSPPVHAKT